MTMWQLIIDHELIAYFSGFTDALDFLRDFGSVECVSLSLVLIGDVKPLCKEEPTV